VYAAITTTSGGDVGKGVCVMQDQHDEFDQEDTGDGRNPVRERMRQLEDEVKNLRTQAHEAEAAKKELAFIKTGIDTASPTGKLFVKAYDGPADPDTIRAAAEEYGLIKPKSPVNADPTEQQAWSISSASHTTGAQSEGMGAELIDKIRSANTPQELEALMNAARTSLQG
jgi:hypothetical protein